MPLTPSPYPSKPMAKWSPAKTAANRKAQIITATVFLLLLAATFGLIFPNPIHAY